MAAPLIQPSFAAGELSPSLYARVDLAKFHVGAALLRNYFVDYRGGVSNRAGTLFVGEVLDSFQAVRLIPFQFSTTQSYVLVFGNLTMQVVINGAFVIDHLTGNDFVLTTPYLGSELALLKFTQSADVMTFCHPNHAPMNLARLAADSWTLTPVNFIPTVPKPTNVNAVPSLTGDATKYVYQVTAIASNGLTESLPSDFDSGSTADNSKTMSQTSGAFITITWDAVPGAVLYNVYRAPEVPGNVAVEGQLFGFVGTSTSTAFVDCNIAPDFTRTPPQAANPFDAGNNPECTAYFQQRQCYGAAQTQPETFFMSKTGDFPNFGYSSPSRSDDSITGTIASQQVNKIKHLIPMNSLIAFSSNGAWRIDSGAQGGPVTPSAIEAAPQAFSGCSDVPPLTINYDILYVQDKQSIVRDLAYNFYVNVYTGADMTTLANHLFYGHTILEWTYAEEPFKIIWCVRDDGVLLSFTYLKEQDVYAWAHHDTLGLFKSVCSVSEGGENAVYVVVQRQVTPGIGGLLQYVERLQSRDMDAVPEYGVPADLAKAWFVDCGLSLPLTFPNVHLTPSGTTGSITVTLSGAVTPALVKGATLRLNNGWGWITNVPGSLTASVDLVEDLTTDFPAFAGTWSTSGALVTEVSGLDHLEGHTVAALANGSVMPQQVVTGGRIRFSQPVAAPVVVGLPYVAQGQSLYLDVPGEPVTSQGRRMTINAVTLRVQDTRGMKVGSSFDDLREFKDRASTLPMGYPIPPFTGDQRIPITDTFTVTKQVCWQQDNPLPSTVLAMIPEVVLGDRPGP